MEPVLKGEAYGKSIRKVNKIPSTHAEWSRPAATVLTYTFKERNLNAIYSSQPFFFFYKIGAFISFL